MLFIQVNRWPMAVFGNIVDVSAFNAYIIYTSIDPSYKKKQMSYRRRFFIKDLATALTTPHIQRRKNLPSGSNAAELVKNIQSIETFTKEMPKVQGSTLGKCGKRGRCHMCTYDLNGNKHSAKCSSCQKFVCPNHLKKIILCSKCDPNQN